MKSSMLRYPPKPNLFSSFLRSLDRVDVLTPIESLFGAGKKAIRKREKEFLKLMAQISHEG